MSTYLLNSQASEKDIALATLGEKELRKRMTTALARKHIMRNLPIALLVATIVLLIAWPLGAQTTTITKLLGFVAFVYLGVFFVSAREHIVRNESLSTAMEVSRRRGARTIVSSENSKAYALTLGLLNQSDFDGLLSNVNAQGELETLFFRTDSGVHVWQDEALDEIQENKVPLFEILYEPGTSLHLVVERFVAILQRYRPNAVLSYQRWFSMYIDKQMHGESDNLKAVAKEHGQKMAEARLALTRLPVKLNKLNQITQQSIRVEKE